MRTAARDGFLVSVFVVGVQLVYRLYPGHFAALMFFSVVALLFYRKLDRIEVALSEERRRDAFRRRQAAGQGAVVFLVTLVVLSLLGSFAVWTWLPGLE